MLHRVNNFVHFAVVKALRTPALLNSVEQFWSLSRIARCLGRAADELTRSEIGDKNAHQSGNVTIICDDVMMCVVYQWSRIIPDYPPSACSLFVVFTLPLYQWLNSLLFCM